MNCSLTKEDFINCKQINQYYKPLETITQQPLSNIKTSDNGERYAKSCKNCKHESYPECPAHGDRYPWNWDTKSDYCGRHDFA